MNIFNSSNHTLFESFEDDLDRDFLHTLNVIQGSIYIPIFCAGIANNLLTILIISLNRDMRTVTNCYLLNLAISDTLPLIVSLPFEISVSELLLGSAVPRTCMSFIFPSIVPPDQSSLGSVGLSTSSSARWDLDQCLDIDDQVCNFVASRAHPVDPISVRSPSNVISPSVARSALRHCRRHDVQAKCKSASGSLLFSPRPRTSTWWNESTISVSSTRISNSSPRSVFTSQRPSSSFSRHWYSASSTLSWRSVSMQQVWSIRFDGQEANKWIHVPCLWIHPRWTTSIVLCHSTIDCHVTRRSFVKQISRLRD